MLWRNYGCGECLKQKQRIGCRHFYRCCTCSFLLFFSGDSGGHRWNPGGSQPQTLQSFFGVFRSFKHWLQVRFAPRALGLGLVWAERSGYAGCFYLSVTHPQCFLTVRDTVWTVLASGKKKSPCSQPRLLFTLHQLGRHFCTKQHFLLHLHTPAATLVSVSSFGAFKHVDKNSQGSNIQLNLSKSCLICFALLHQADRHDDM